MDSFFGDEIIIGKIVISYGGFIRGQTYGQFLRRNRLTYLKKGYTFLCNRFIVKGYTFINQIGIPISL